MDKKPPHEAEINSDISLDCDSGSTCGINILQDGSNSIKIVTNNYYSSHNATTNCPHEDAVNTVSLALKTIYKHLALPKLAWLDQGMDLSISKLYMKLQLDIERHFIDLEELFNHNRGCNRLLIEGKSGFGKTTLSIKLLSDWANNASYMEQFKLAFLIPLNNLSEECGIEKILTDTVPNSRCDLQDVITKAGEKVLIVLDGFDEVPKSRRQAVLRILYGQMFCEATVILTYRNNEFYVQPEELQQLFGITALSREFSKVKYTITGITDGEEVVRFIREIGLFRDINPEFDVQRLKRIAKYNPELFQSPLFVVMFTFLIFSRDQNVEELTTKTKLYCALFNAIIKHNLVREKIPVSKNFNIFDFKDESSEKYRRILKDFGQSIITNSVECKLQFDVDHPLIEEVYKLGLVVKHRRLLFLETTSHFEAFHKSILEFLVAYSFWYKCSETNFNSNFNDDLIKKVVFIFQQHGNGHILHFFWGLCETNIMDVLIVWKLYAIYWDVRDFMWELAARNKFCGNLLINFCNYMPFHCYAPSIESEELKLNLISGRINTVCLLAHDVIDLPKVEILQLRVIVTDESKLANQTFLHLQNVRCGDFILDFQFRNITLSAFQTCLRSLSIVQNSRNKLINLNSELFNWLPSNIEGIQINQVECSLSGKELQKFDPFNKFSKAFRGEPSLQCEVVDNTFTTKETISLLPLSADSVKLVKNGDRVEFDLKNLPLDERKKWFQNLKNNDFNVESRYTMIHYLFITSMDKSLLLSILNFSCPHILRCLSTHLTIAVDAMPYLWPGFTYVQKLSLICEDQSPTSWEKIEKFKSLQSLELQMLCKLRNEDHIDAILNCVCHLFELIHVSLHIELKDDIVFIKSLVERFIKQNVLKCNCFVLDTISIVSVISFDRTIVIELLKCVQLKLLLKVQFYISPDFWIDIVRQIGLDYSVFKVSYISSCGQNSGDSELSVLPIAFSRPRDQTMQITCIQIQLK